MAEVVRLAEHEVQFIFLAGKVGKDFTIAILDGVAAALELIDERIEILLAHDVFASSVFRFVNGAVHGIDVGLVDEQFLL